MSKRKKKRKEKSSLKIGKKFQKNCDTQQELTKSGTK
jgi:hypothetical protein